MIVTCATGYGVVGDLIIDTTLRPGTGGSGGSPAPYCVHLAPGTSTHAGRHFSCEGNNGYQIKQYLIP